SHPEPRPRPRALTLPPRYREHNVWLALERAVDAWTRPGPEGLPPIQPHPPEPGTVSGLSLFDGPIRELPPTPGITLALTALPRPNPAFWTLSALWAGWLWGREAAASFKPVLRRRRYDWNWHTAALRAAGEALAARLPEGATVVGLAPEAEPGFTAAALAAFDAAGFALQGCALRSDPDAAQFLWRRADAPGAAPIASPDLAAHIQEIGAGAAGTLLRRRGEPARWATIHAAGWCQLARERQLAGPFARDGTAGEPPLQTVNEALEAGVSYRRGFLRSGGGGEADRESGLWWLREETGAQPPLSDRVEAEVQRLLSAGAELTEAALDEAVCAAFPGLLTPGARLVAACLRSYGSETAPGSGAHLPRTQMPGGAGGYRVAPGGAGGYRVAPGWRLRPEDDPRRRAAELEQLRRQLIALGARLGYTVTGAVPLEWRLQHEVAYTLGIITSAAFSRYALDPALDPARTLVVLPGGRAALAGHKLKRDPRLRLAVERGLRFVKYRLVRRLSDDTALSRDNFDERLKLDPLHDTEAQMSLL
ncbi:MAG: hypothetical protein HY784_17575, partial [Chloroflexi bacterium]|nr:hypothetical protein [Chloroflexota bacterium]